MYDYLNHTRSTHFLLPKIDFVPEWFSQNLNYLLKPIQHQQYTPSLVFAQPPHLTSATFRIFLPNGVSSRMMYNPDAARSPLSDSPFHVVG